MSAPWEEQRQGAVRLAEPYVDRYGKSRSTGKKNLLKSSQLFCLL